MEEYVRVSTRMRRTRILKVGYNQTPQDKKKIPAVRFGGVYLEDLGFTIDGYYEHTINEDNSITVRAVSNVEGVAVEADDN